MNIKFNFTKPTEYTIGFVLSIVLTSLAFLAIKWDLSSNMVIAFIVSFAVLQLIVQLVFFLHINKDPAPGWNIMMFILAGWFVLAIIIGSIWIMSNLNYNMSPKDYQEKIHEQEAIPHNN